MKQNSFLTLLRKSIGNIARNWLVAVPTVLVIAIVLTMFHGLLVIHDGAQKALKGVQQKFSLTVYLKDDADPFEVGNVITELEKNSAVVPPVTYTSKEAAWNLMSKTFALDNELLKKYKFSLPASLTITPRAPEDAAEIEDFLETNAANLTKSSPSKNDKQKNITNQMVEFVEGVQRTTQRTLLFFILLFIVGGALLVSSTIHLAITSRRLEINIMKLVGASFAKITMPFVIEGLVLSIIAFATHMVLLIIVPVGLAMTNLQLNALAFEFLATVVLGTVVSYLTATLHLRKKTVF
ncbi:MAG: permease-like cell division protein FtsX [Patescibacteria group bacterium]